MAWGFFKGTKAKLLPSTGIEFSDGRFYTYGSGSPEGVVTATVGSFYSDTTNGIIYTKNSGAGNTGWDTVTSSATNYLLVTDTKSSGTAGGTFTSGAWRTRDLNTVGANYIAGSSLASNQVSLPAGTYRAKAQSMASYTDQNQIKLRNVTDSADLLSGTPQSAPTSGGAFNAASFLVGEFTIAGTKAIELQHQCVTTKATDGFGMSTSFSISNIYSILEIWRIA